MELRVRGLEQDQVTHPGHHPGPAALVGDRRGAHVAAVAGEGVRMRCPGVLEPHPRVHLQRHPGPPHRLDVLDEVPGQRQAERLRLPRLLAVLLRVRVDGVLRRVRGQALRVVPGEVDVGEVAGEGDTHVVVDEIVGVRVAVDPHDPGLRLAVLVVPERDSHERSAPSRGGVGERSQQRRHSGGAGPARSPGRRGAHVRGDRGPAGGGDGRAGVELRGRPRAASDPGVQRLTADASPRRATVRDHPDSSSGPPNSAARNLNLVVRKLGASWRSVKQCWRWRSISGG